MTRRLSFRSWATGAIVLAAVSACGANPNKTSLTPLPSTVSSTGPTGSPAQLATSSATTVVHRYFAVLDTIRQNDAIPISQLSSVATSTQLAAEEQLVTHERQQDLRQTGNTLLGEIKVQSVDLDNFDPSVGQIPTVTIDVCWDVSHADLVNKAGHSVVSPSRVDRAWTRYTVANYHWTTDPSSGWRIASSQDLKQAPCAAS